MDARFQVRGYTFRRIDEFEISIQPPNNFAWHVRYADKNDGFAKFIWDFASAMVAPEEPQEGPSE